MTCKSRNVDLKQRIGTGVHGRDILMGGISRGVFRTFVRIWLYVTELLGRQPGNIALAARQPGAIGIAARRVASSALAARSVTTTALTARWRDAAIPLAGRTGEECV